MPQFPKLYCISKWTFFGNLGEPIGLADSPLWVRPCQFLRADIVVVQYTVSVYICSHNHLAFVKKVFFVVVFLGQKTEKSPFSSNNSEGSIAPNPFLKAKKGQGY